MYQTCPVMNVGRDSLQNSHSLPRVQTSTTAALYFVDWRWLQSRHLLTSIFFKERKRFPSPNQRILLAWANIHILYEMIKEQLVLFMGRCAGYVWMGWRIALQRRLNESNSKMVCTVRLQLQPRRRRRSAAAAACLTDGAAVRVRRDRQVNKKQTNK